MDNRVEPRARKRPPILHPAGHPGAVPFGQGPSGHRTRLLVGVEAEASEVDRPGRRGEHVGRILSAAAGSAGACRR